ncbi:hypothetical protein D0469_01125 [Peribacillus saganii]|uniref:ABC transporter substrate-binding protein n=1 Tax=Peribacillus saganii TaxID=2303992 RepID=A0A372LUI5_9BACI|nr:TRAP transporter substrate-binding protein DctP [Peribacillus saganii]RFU71472.1 hypothetical protein D0469_01125 [Peribacillus saganii]
MGIFKLKKRLGVIGLTLLMILLTACSGSSKSSSEEKKNEEETYILSGVTALPNNDLLSQAFFVFAEKIEKNSNGRIKFEYKGGPETIPSAELGEAVGSGVVDIGVTPAAYYASAVPEGLALSYSELTTEEELKNGAIDHLNKIHNQKLNVQLLGRGAEVGFGLYTKEKVQSLEDFKGLRMRGTPTYAPMYKALGAELISMPGGDIFESLDKGVIDGFGWTAVGISDLGVQDTAKYKMAPNFYRMDVVTIVNLDKWNSLPEDIQKIIMDTQREVEKEMVNVTQEFIDKEEPKLKEAGVQTVDLGEEFLKVAYGAGWKFIEEKIPDQSKELSELFRK